MEKEAKTIFIVALVLVLILVISIVVLVSAAPKGPKPQCRDGVDNDDDGLTDWPTDPGCANKNDNTETSSSLICDNGQDEADDADTLADFRITNGDPGCTSTIDSSEIDGQCDDLIDNDDDGHIDFGSPTRDSECTSFSDNDESPRDFCNEPDFGVITVQGTTTGEDDSIQFNLTDFCLDSINLREYRCSGVTNDYDPNSQDFDCSINNFTSCSNGACV